MRKIYNSNEFIDALGLISIGVFSLGYVVIGRPFAELNIHFSFLNLPIFIGEWLLFLCLFLFLIRKRHHLTKINKRRILISAYFVFVLVKALHGYFQWGLLAFRHAAFFHYHIFIIFGYSFYRRNFFTVKKIVSLSLLIIFIFIVRTYNDYWTLTFFILVSVLVCSLRPKWLKYVLLTALLLVTPYKFLFCTSRMMMVANAIAMAYLMLALYFIFKIKRELKVVIFVLCALLVIGGAMKFMDRTAARSIVSFGKIWEAFDAYDADVMKVIGSYEASYPKASQGVALYNPNQPIFFNLDGYKKLQDEVSGATVSGTTSAASGNVPVASGTAPVVSNAATFQSPGQKTEVRLYNPNPFPFLKKNAEAVNSFSHGIPGEIDGIGKGPQGRNFEGAIINALFRLFIWRDMLTELIRVKPIFGFDFGKPLRSISLEVLNWGESEWRRDGWIAAHNSYLDMIYRAGIIGISAILAVFVILFKMIKESIQYRSFIGVLLCGIIINWFVAANFLLIFELPYTAIPIWTLFGLTYAYVGTLRPLIPAVNPEKGNTV